MTRRTLNFDELDETSIKKIAVSVHRTRSRMTFSQVICHFRFTNTFNFCRLTMTVPVTPPRLRRRHHDVQQSDSTKARLLLALACLWPLVVFFFAASNSSTPNSEAGNDSAVVGPHQPGLESIRNLLDRVDILGYGPTHPRVAVVVVGDDRSKMLSSVESVFRYAPIVMCLSRYR